MRSMKCSWLLMLTMLTVLSCKKNVSTTPDGSIGTTGNPDTVGMTGIYAVGDVNSTGAANFTQATIWKNGIATTLSANNSSAKAVAIQGKDVYVVGYDAPGTDHKACYWKNGTLVKLTDDTYPSEATAIAISGSDVYVVGQTRTDYGYDYATVWKNGVATQLRGYTDGRYAGTTTATGIALNGNDVYVWGGVLLHTVI